MENQNDDAKLEILANGEKLYLKKKSDNQCTVTGFKKEKVGDLEVHHLDETSTYPRLALEVDNGIVLHKEIHVLFHKK